MNNYLCEEVVIQILARLPTKSLVRFMAVCRLWKSIITSHEFGLVSKPPPRTLVHTNRECYTLLDPDFEKGPDFPLKHSGVKCELLGSDDGLLCVGITPQSPTEEFCYRVLVWNPFVRRHALIPNHPLVDHDFELCYGFGATINDYKYVRIVGFSVGKYCLRLAIEIYSMRSGTWRPRIYLDYETYVNKFFSCAAVVVRGRLHWLGTDDCNRTKILASFELEDEVFEELVLPECLANHEFFLRCAVVNESLALVAYGGEGRHSTVWVMGEYGDANSWSKLYEIDVTLGSFERVVIEMVHVLKNGHLLLGLKPFEHGQYHVHPPKLVAYNPNTRKTSDFDGVLSSSSCHQVFVLVNCYQESLALLGDHRAVADHKVLSVSEQSLTQHFHDGHYHWYPLLQELDKWEKKSM